MTRASIAVLADRGVVRASGPDTLSLLDGVLTNDIDRLKSGSAIHAALLTPQGKILVPMFVVADDDGVLIDVRGDAVADLIKRLTLYRLRAKVTFEDVSDRVTVAALWDGEPEVPAGVIAYRDPRSDAMGHRLLFPTERLAEIPADIVDVAAYHDRRIDRGVAEDGIDFPIGDTYPHEANFDHTASVDFKKGCFVGQEVVSRMQHKTVVKKRVVRVTAPIGAAHLRAGVGVHVTGVPVPVGLISSVSRDGLAGLAMVKLDRVVDSLAKGGTVTAGSGPDATEVTIDEAPLGRYRAAVAVRQISEGRGP